MQRLLPFLSLLFLGVSSSGASPLHPALHPTITLHLQQPFRTCRTSATLQVVTNPLLADDAEFHSPIYSAAWKNLAALPVKHARCALWYPFGRRACAAMEPPSPANVGRCVGPVQSGFNLTIDCEAGVGAPRGNTIASIDFSSYGLPLRKMHPNTGMCQGFNPNEQACSTSKEEAGKLQAFLEAKCVGKKRCSIEVPRRGSSSIFGNPCPGEKEEVRLAVLAQCTRPYNYSSWDFSLMDQMLVNFMNATKGAQPVVNIPTQPMWAFDTPVWSYVDSPNMKNGLSQLFGTATSSPGSLARISSYYKRVFEWYTKGGFRDEFGRFLKSGLHLDFEIFEITNEPDAEHHHTAKTYTDEYDATVKAIREVNPRIIPVGLSLANHTKQEESWFWYFLNKSNHEAGVLPLGWISYHFYAKAAHNWPLSLETLFDRADEFLVTVRSYERIRKAIAPEVKTTLNELGTFAPTSNLYWTASSALNAYLYLKLAVEGIDAVGWSQLVAHPSIPELGLQDTDPSVAMLSYKTGQPNQRYWSLKLLASYTGPGFKMYKATTSSRGLTVQYFENATLSTLVVINRKAATKEVSVVGFPAGLQPLVYSVDEHTHVEPKPQEFTGSLTLLPFAVQVVTARKATALPIAKELQ